jgi:septal ring factor EnvC (AmiA/AmiB activator)
MADTLLQEVEDELDVHTEFTPDEPREPELVEEAPGNAKRVIQYPVADNVIAELSQKYMPLRINGVDDKAGFQAADTARKKVKKLRGDVEKTRKELKADALEYGRKVDKEAKRLKDLLEPIEKHLTQQVDAIKDEKIRLEREWLDQRIEALQAVTETLPPESLLKKLSDDEFETLLKNETAAHEARVREEEERRAREAAERAELERLREEERKRQAEEAERLRAEREEIERQKAELAEQQRIIDEEKAERERREREEREAAERKRLEEEAAQRERERIEQERREAEERKAREEALRPDREKLASVAEAVLSIDVPVVGSDLQLEREQIVKVLNETADLIRSLAASE